MTIKQKLVAKKILENPGKPISEAMREAGYSEAMAKNPQDLKESKGWLELMEQYIPDSKILKAHSDAFEATKWNDFTGEREEDHLIRLRASDLGYKLKNKLTAGVQFNTQNNTYQLTDEQLKRILQG